MQSIPDRIKKSFEKRIHKSVLDLTVDFSTAKACSYCGYGNLHYGTATLATSLDADDAEESDQRSSGDSDEDQSSFESRDYRDVEENITFKYWSGCMTYSSELSI